MADYAQPLSAGALATVLGLDHHGFDRMWDWCEGLCADIANFENDPELTALGERTKADLGEAIEERLAAATTTTAPSPGSSGKGRPRGDRQQCAADDLWRDQRASRRNRPCHMGRADAARAALCRRRPTQASAPHRRVFRVYSPVGTVTRQATTDLELAGVAIPKGDLVSGVLRSINLDESHWNAPTTIDLERREGSHATRSRWALTAASASGSAARKCGSVWSACSPGSLISALARRRG